MITAAARKQVRVRARNRCEYCRMSQDVDGFFAFHVEHVIPRQHGGSDDPSNLALACNHCNLHKGPNLTGIDPDSGRVVRLFNPREQRWEQHFELQADRVVGRTATGRTTVWVLAMNAEDQRRIRAEGS